MRLGHVLATVAFAGAFVSFAFSGCIDDDCYATRTCPTSGTSAASGGGVSAGGTSGSAGSMGKALGESCGAAEECASNQCADSVCCESACDATCEACNLSGNEGTCSPHPPATDPDGECAPGVCDGASACAIGNHLWSKSFGSNGSDLGLAVAFDGMGNAYFEGAFSGTNTVDFGGGGIQAPTTAFVKFDPGGNHVWSIPLGNAGGDLHVSSSGAIALGGSTTGTVECGGDGTSTSGMSDVLLMKFDTGGCVFAETWGDADDEYGSAVINSDGSVVIAGTFTGSLNLGGTPLSSAGGTDAFLAKFSPTNALVWRVGFGGPGDDGFNGLALTPGGDVVVIGGFEGSITIGATNLVSKGAGDFVVASFDQAGNAQWSKSFGSSAEDGATDLAVDSNDSIVLIGMFGATIDFGGGPLSVSGMSDMFVAKLDASGDHVFSAAYGSTGGEFPFGVSVDASGSIVVGGFFWDSFSLGGEPLNSAGGSDAFVAKFATDGTHLWSKRFGDPEPDSLRGLAVDPQGNILLAGGFTSSIGFGGSILMAGFAGGAYIAKLSP